MMECPTGNSTTQRVFQVDGYWIRECQSCHLRCVEITTSQEHVNKVYSDNYFTEGGAGYSNYFDEAKIITAHGRYYGKILNRFIAPGRVLDVGAAAGFILKGLSEYGWKGVGLEPNRSMAEYGRINTGVDIKVGTLEQFESDEKFDLVNMVQVLPHFYNLERALSTAAEHTKPNGYWLIETWNKDSLLAQMMGANWHEYSPPSVLHFFSPKSLKHVVKQFGFEEVARGRPAKKINGSHAKSLLQHKLQDSTVGKLGAKLLNFVPNGLTLPYPSFDLFWALYKRSA
jgi:2-polyprenyl-3-methyl-5-hydroxy-6-metoxy-1,4-benzoquinol methylase